MFKPLKSFLQFCQYLLCFFTVGHVYSQGFDSKLLSRCLSTSNPALYAHQENQIRQYYVNTPNAHRPALLAFFDKYTKSSHTQVATRALYWKAAMLLRPPFEQRAESEKSMLLAVDVVLQSGDEALMVECLYNAGYHFLNIDKNETALFCFLKSAEIREHSSDEHFAIKNGTFQYELGNVYYGIQEYELSLQLLLKANATGVQDAARQVSLFNSIGLNYLKMKRYQLAMTWFGKSLALAKKIKHTAWQGIIQGNMGDVLLSQGQYLQALPLLKTDYIISLKTDSLNAAHSLQCIANIYAQIGKLDSAQILSERAMQILEANKYSSTEYLRQCHGTLAMIYQKVGHSTKYMLHTNAYHKLSDSLTLSIANSRVDMVNARLKLEKSNHSLKTLEQEKNAAQRRRIALVLMLLGTVAIAFLLIKTQNTKHQAQQQQLLHQKQLAEIQAKNAQLQLSHFAKNLTDKQNLLAQLQQKLQSQATEVLSQLPNKPLLTDGDWLTFKDTFQTAYPSFFARLQNLAPQISPAEQRLAALIYLRLGNKEMAVALGIGPEAVRKTKSRLRQRLNLELSENLEDIIISF
jgi:tetratricopeptide (TPR) repeat protein